MEIGKMARENFSKLIPGHILVSHLKTGMQ